MTKKYLLNIPLIYDFFMGEYSNLRVSNSVQEFENYTSITRFNDLDYLYRQWYNNNNIDRVVFKNVRNSLVLKSIMYQIFIMNSIERNNTYDSFPEPPLNKNKLMIIKHKELSTDMISKFISDQLIGFQTGGMCERDAIRDSLLLWFNPNLDLSNLEFMIVNMLTNKKGIQPEIIVTVLDKAELNSIHNYKIDLINIIKNSLKDDLSVFYVELIQNRGLNVSLYLSFENQIEENDLFFNRFGYGNIREEIMHAIISTSNNLSSIKNYLENSTVNKLYKGFNTLDCTFTPTKFKNKQFINGYLLEDAYTAIYNLMLNKNLSIEDFPMLTFMQTLI